MKKALFTNKIALLAALLVLTTQAFAGGRIYYAGGIPNTHAWLWSGDAHVFDLWPGQTMQTTTLQYGGHTVSYVDVITWELAPANAIFNNGTDQDKTGTLDIPGYNSLYPGTGTEWVAYSMPTGEFWTLSGQLGNDAGWTDHFMTQDGVNQVCTLALAAGKEYYFKMRHVANTDTWYTKTEALTRTTCKDVVLAVSTGIDDNTAIATTIAGDYIFSYNTETNALSITYPDALAESEINTTAVPAENEAVLIQAYYWAHVENEATRWIPFGSVQWHDLDLQADELGSYFDLVWLAPSAATEDYTGFLPNNYSNQNNIWGSVDSLRTLISHLHAAGSKVVADIVINHSSPAGTGNYCQWDEFNFGNYGVYYPEATWITKDDEIFISKYNTNTYYYRYDTGVPGGENAGIKEDTGDCQYVEAEEWDEKTCGSQRDWSYAEFNCVYSRDWAHKKKEVREMSRAYLTWMKEYIGYDGWRYDFAKGINGSRIDNYNKASNACFSVAEVFDGEIAREIGLLEDTHFNTYVFDFPAKYHAMNEGVRYGNYGEFKGTATTTTLYNYKRNTVTFVDNHDTFRENYNLCGTPNAIGDAGKVLMANAYILAMPGVPCVFYPHWATFKDEIKAMIDARHATRVHSESAVVDEAGEGYYRATITGKNGTIKLFFGPNSGWQNCPEGYQPAYVGSDAGFYYQTNDGVYIKHNFDGPTTWSWKAMKDNGDGSYSVRGIYNGAGCNWVQGLDFENAPYIAGENLNVDADVKQGQMAKFTLTLNPFSIHVEAVKPVYFMNTGNWANVKAYAWSKTNVDTPWSGANMTLEGTFNGNTVYSYYADDAYTSIIFNPGGDEGKTADLEMHEGQCYVYGTGWVELSSLNMQLAIPSCNWASLYLPLNVTLDDGLYAYYASSRTNDEITLTLLDDNKIPAHTGVVVKGNEGNYTLTATAEYVPSVVNMFGGTKVATYANDLNNDADNVLYVLSKSVSTPASPMFAPINSNIEIPAAKAYLLFDSPLAAPDGIRFVIAQENTTTGVEGVEASEEVIKQLRGGHLYIIRSGVEYNVLGQRTR